MPAFLWFRSISPAAQGRATGRVRRFFALAAVCAVALGSASANAGGLQVSPVSMALSKTERAGVFTISNNSETSMNVQARVFKWTQSAQDEYVLEPTNDLIVTPPIMQLAPGAPQELRLIRTLSPSEGEQHYRLIVDQLPTPSAQPQKGISLLIRHNIPVFLNSTDSPTVLLQWRAQASGKDKTRITIHNPDKNRAQIARVWLEKSGASSTAPSTTPTTLLSEGLTGYVLPGNTLEREFNIPLAQLQAAGMQLKAQINGTETTIQLGN